MAVMTIGIMAGTGRVIIIISMIINRMVTASSTITRIIMAITTTVITHMRKVIANRIITQATIRVTIQMIMATKVMGMATATHMDLIKESNYRHRQMQKVINAITRKVTQEGVMEDASS
jgi:hypothetical protein